MRCFRQIISFFSFIAGVIASVAVPVTDGDVASILRVLDSELERREEYIDSRRSSIDSLKGLLVRRDAAESLKLAVMLEIGDNYSAFNTDSAVLFFNEGYVRSIAQGLDSTAVRFALRAATYLPLQLRIERANELMDSIALAGVPPGLRAEYFDAVRQMSSFIGNFFVSSPEVYKEYSEKHHDAQLGLLRELDSSSEKYRLNSGEVSLLEGQLL